MTMPSDLERAIAATRRRIEQREAPVRATLVQLYEQTVDDLLVDLQAVTRLVQEARAAGIEISPSWLQRQSRYQHLINLVNAELTRFAEDGALIVEGGRTLAAQGATSEAVALMVASGLPAAQVALNTSAVERLVSSLTGATPVRDILSRYGPETASTITEGLTSGMARGLGPRQIERNIRRQLLADGVEARLEALVRTELLRAYRGSLAQTFKPYEHLGIGYRWVAAKSVRTCLSCLARDGQITPKPPTEQHVCCRCIFHLVPAGVAIPYETGEEWFARQPVDVQRSMIPSTEAFNAYRNGKLTLASFSGTRHSPTWGTTYYERSGREALKRA